MLLGSQKGPGLRTFVWSSMGAPPGFNAKKTLELILYGTDQASPNYLNFNTKVMKTVNIKNGQVREALQATLKIGEASSLTEGFKHGTPLTPLTALAHAKMHKHQRSIPVCIAACIAAFIAVCIPTCLMRALLCALLRAWLHAILRALLHALLCAFGMRGIVIGVATIPDVRRTWCCPCCARLRT
eukprot:1154774-Pelagomonas_calceolata.AAC.1